MVLPIFLEKLSLLWDGMSIKGVGSIRNTYNMITLNRSGYNSQGKQNRLLLCIVYKITDKEFLRNFQPVIFRYCIHVLFIYLFKHQFPPDVQIASFRHILPIFFYHTDFGGDGGLLSSKYNIIIFHNHYFVFEFVLAFRLDVQKIYVASVICFGNY